MNIKYYLNADNIELNRKVCDNLQSPYVKTPSGTFECVSSTECSYPEIEDFGDKRFFYYTPKSITKNKHTVDDNSSYISTTLTIQNFNANDIIYGNVSSIETYIDPDDLSLETPLDNFDFYTKNSFTYNNLPEIWLIGLINTKDEFTWATENTEIDHQHFDYDYYSNSPLLSMTAHIPNESIQLTTYKDFHYDDYGNTTIVREYAPFYSPNIPDRYTYYDYSTTYYHRFITETKRVLNNEDYITTKTFDNKT